jgi:D-xylose transport system permease protein
MSTSPPDAAVAGESTPPDDGGVESPDDASAAADRILLGGNELVANSLREYLGATYKRIRSGESGVLPVVVGLIIIVVIFQTQNSKFLSAGNLTNLLQQGGVFVMLAMAEIFVLLLGEIDLSVGFVGAVGAAITAEMVNPPHNVSWILAILAGLAACALIGIIQGVVITQLGLPSFVVTLAGLLFWGGFLLFFITHDTHASGGTIQIADTGVINDIVNGSLSPSAGWIVMIAAVAAFAVMRTLGDRRRRSNGLVVAPYALTALKVAGMAVAGVILVVVCNHNRGRGVFVLRGVPWVVPIVAVIVVGYTFLLGRTRFGRYLYAIGGNAEASRRAGISLKTIKTLAFMLTSFTAGLGFVIYLSQLGSISTGVGGANYVLYAVAAAVIGGTSLFGGRGKMIHAVLGGVVITTIYNGMGLIQLGPAAQSMVIALVLLAAVIVDAVARRGRSTV